MRRGGDLKFEFEKKPIIVPPPPFLIFSEVGSSDNSAQRKTCMMTNVETLEREREKKKNIVNYITIQPLLVSYLYSD